MIKVSQRSRHDRIISVLDDLLTLIEERCGKDINPNDIISAMEKENQNEDIKPISGQESTGVQDERAISAQEPDTEPEEVG